MARLPSICQNIQPFTGNGDVSIWVKNLRMGRKTTNKQTNNIVIKDEAMGIISFLLVSCLLLNVLLQIFNNEFNSSWRILKCVIITDFQVIITDFQKISLIGPNWAPELEFEYNMIFFLINYIHIIYEYKEKKNNSGNFYRHPSISCIPLL